MGSTMLVLSVLCALAGTVLGLPREEFEFGEFRNTNLDDPKYRLQDSVQPTHIFVDLDVYLEQARFDGVVRLQVQVQEENLNQIVMHQKVVAINTVSVVNAANQPVPLRFPDPFETDDHFEIVKINFASALQMGQYTITIDYQGKINENPFDRGFYMGYYYENTNLRLYATTQFQPFYARAAFPCFDEPQFKSQFVISITRDTNLSPSYSNMAIQTRQHLVGDRTRETFLPTPIVSAYLVAFHVSDFIETNITSTATKPFGIISRRGVADQHNYAAEIGLKISDALDDFTGIDYYDHGQGQPMKNDHIALPDFPSGAMENWGMVNYREAYLLYDEQNTNMINKIFIATIIAHELAHKWFGNLVTCFWWSNLWLNESFASFFEYFSAHAADPSLELADQFVVDYVHSALVSDAADGATSMNNSAVVDNPSIWGHFSTTSYAKGASVLRTLEHLVGPRTFRRALRYYLIARSYKLGTPQDMYDAFTRATNEDLDFRRDYPTVIIEDLFDSWVQNAGSPVVKIDYNHDTGIITFTQSRYLVSGGSTDQLWQIPLTWTIGNSPNFASTKPNLVLTTRSTTYQGPTGHNWIVGNIAQSGLYRVNYDDHSWEMLAAFLSSNNNNRQSIHKLNRAQIVNDALFFLRSGDINAELAFDILAFLRHETDYYVWAGALGQLEWIRRRLDHRPEADEQFKRYMLHQMNTVIEHLGYDEVATDDTSRILNRIQIMNVACNFGHEGCVSDSLQKWNSFRTNSSNLVPVNLRRHVYCVGIREGDRADYDFLFNLYNSSQNTADMVVILRALACTRDEDTLRHYLTQSMQNDRIRLHDRTNAFSFALQGNPENVSTVVSFLQENFAEIRESYGGPDRLNVAIGALAGQLTNFEAIDSFRTWVYENQVALGSSFGAGVNAANTALNNLNWGNNNILAIFTEVIARNSVGSITASISLFLVTLLTFFLY